MVFATQETSPYDIAVVSLEEDLDGVPVPVPAERFHEGKGQRGSLVWGGPQEGKSVLGALTLQIRGQSPRSAPFPTPAGVMSQAGTLLHPGYSALAGVALGGLPAHAQHAQGPGGHVEFPAKGKARLFPEAPQQCSVLSLGGSL